MENKAQIVFKDNVPNSEKRIRWIFRPSRQTADEDVGYSDDAVRLRGTLGTPLLQEVVDNDNGDASLPSATSEEIPPTAAASNQTIKPSKAEKPASNDNTGTRPTEQWRTSAQAQKRQQQKKKAEDRKRLFDECCDTERDCRANVLQLERSI